MVIINSKNKKTKTMSVSLFFVFSLLILLLQSCTFGSFSVSYTGDYCNDGLQDRDETGVDCGGQYCDSCANDDDKSEQNDEDGTADADDAVSNIVCTDDDDNSDESNESEIYVPSTTTITTTYADGDTDTETYNDVCSESILIEYSCLEDQYLTEVPVTCAFGCTDDNDACAQDETDDDFDDDGLTDEEEATYGTYPTITDSDYDGLTDYEEVMMYGTDPLDRDSDDDGIRDDHEIVRATDPLDEDTDDDNLSDYDEVQVYNSDPLVADTCVESDDGNDLSVKGTVAGYSSSTDTTFGSVTDECISDSAYVEYYCSDLYWTAVSGTCASGICSDGICVPE